MSLDTLLGTPCTITRRTAGTALDDDGNAIPTTTTSDTTCSLQQRQRQEPSDEGEFSVTEWLLFLPSGTALDTSDKVTIEGKDYEVTGEPWDTMEGSPAVHHVEATVKRTG